MGMYDKVFVEEGVCLAGLPDLHGVVECQTKDFYCALDTYNLKVDGLYLGGNPVAHTGIVGIYDIGYKVYLLFCRGKLIQSFPTQEEAENALAELVDYAMQARPERSE